MPCRVGFLRRSCWRCYPVGITAVTSGSWRVGHRTGLMCSGLHLGHSRSGRRMPRSLARSILMLSLVCFGSAGMTLAATARPIEVSAVPRARFPALRIGVSTATPAPSTPVANGQSAAHGQRSAVADAGARRDARAAAKSDAQTDQISPAHAAGDARTVCVAQADLRRRSPRQRRLPQRLPSRLPHRLPHRLPSRRRPTHQCSSPTSTSLTAPDGLAGGCCATAHAARPLVALSFDDCYSTTAVRAIAQILRDAGAPGTFFPVSDAVVASRALWRSDRRRLRRGQPHPAPRQPDQDRLQRRTCRGRRRPGADRAGHRP